MTSLLFRISLSAVLSIASLLVIIYRVSPITSPGLAVPFFFLTLFLSLASTVALLSYAAWVLLPVETLDAGKKLTIALREGTFFATATVLVLVFHLLSILNVWIVVLIYAVFLLVELALHV